MTQSHAIHHLVYCSYSHNRTLSPAVKPERWSAVFDDAAKLEARYQREKAVRCAAGPPCRQCGGPTARNDGRFWSCDGAYPHLCDGIIRPARMRR